MVASSLDRLNSPRSLDWLFPRALAMQTTGLVKDMPKRDRRRHQLQQVRGWSIC